MKIAAYIRNPEVAEFTFSEANATHLRRRLPACSLTVCSDEPAFLRALADAEIVLVWRFNQEWFAQAPALRLISTPAAGRDYFQIEPPPSVEVWYGAFHGLIMGETALGMMLGISRRLIPQAMRMTHQAETWPRGVFSGQVRSLRGSHVVILGFGAIGHHIGRLLKPFGVRITGIRRNPTATPATFTASDTVLSIDALDSVLPTADHLLCVLPSGEATTHLINARRLALLPPTAYIYNIGRGNAIDETALAAALSNGRIAGAVLDVFHEEPLPPNSPLRTAPNAFLYPHVSALAPDYLELYIDEFTERLKQRERL